jgi:hypothetical protein
LAEKTAQEKVLKNTLIMGLLLFLTFNSLFNLTGSKNMFFYTGMFLEGSIFSLLKIFEKKLRFWAVF